MFYGCGQIHYPTLGSDAETDDAVQTLRGNEKVSYSVMRLFRKSKVGSREVHNWLDTARRGAWLGIS